MRNPFSICVGAARKIGANVFQGTRRPLPHPRDRLLHVENLEERMLLSASAEQVVAPLVSQELAAVTQSIVIDDHGNNQFFATPVEVPSQTAGRIDPRTDTDWFSFEAVEGTTYQIDLLGAGSSLVLTLYDSEISVLERRDGQSKREIKWIAPESGVYFLATKSSSVLATDYSLRIEVTIDDHGDSLANATPVTDFRFTGVIENVDDIDVFTFEATAGTDYRASSTFPNWSVHAPDGTSLAGEWEDNGEFGSFPVTYPSNGPFRAETSGTYFLTVGKGVAGIEGVDAIGDYSLSISGNSNGIDQHSNDWFEATEISGGVTAGRINFLDDLDLFKFDDVAGQRYTFSVEHLEGLSFSEVTLYELVPDESFPQFLVLEPIAFERSSGANASSIQWSGRGGTIYIGVTGSPTGGKYELVAELAVEGRQSVDGTLGNGVAAVDGRQGKGYILFSEENVRSRFSAAPPIANTADQMIAVFYNFEDGKWYYDNNSNQVAFTPRITDRLLAEIDFSADTATSLRGQSGLVHGIYQGYMRGDLVFIADQFAGASNDGEFEVSGTYFEATPRGRFEIGDRGFGVAAVDDREGTGYLMFSEENVHSRFSSYPPIANNADHLIAVFLENGKWYFDNNGGQIPFLPRETDRLLAEVDFTNDTVSNLQGQSGSVNGIALGYGDGDLEFAADQFVGSANDGEFEITQGTFFEIEFLPPQTTFNLDSNSMGRGIAAVDSRTGSGFIMYSEQDLFARFADNPPVSSNSPHLITVFYEDDQWFFDNNVGQIPFTPQANDRLLAVVDFTNDQVTPLLGVDGIESGIRMGYANGDLTFVANQFAGTTNAGEFEAGGTFFEVDPPRDAIRTEFTGLNSGIAAPDSQTGTGFILYSEENLHSRFAENPPYVSSADHMIAVLYEEGQWYYVNNDGQFLFTPRTTDRLVAQVDFDLDTVVGLQGINELESGIAKGYLRGNLVFAANQFAQRVNPGEFKVLGTYFETEPRDIQRSELGQLNQGVAALDSRQGKGFMLYSKESLRLRFAEDPPFFLNSDHMVAVFEENGQWFYDTNAGQAPFSPRATDRLLAEIDFTNDTIRSLQGTEGFEQGIAKGYFNGDLTFYANRFGENLNEVGEFQIVGSYFETSYRSQI